MLEFRPEALDVLTREATMFGTFADLVACSGVPILDPREPADLLLADLYDQAQELRGDPRRACRDAARCVPQVIRRAQRCFTS
jgi:hypothetical protein